MKKGWIVFFVALGGVMLFWLITDPPGFANFVSTVAGGLRTAAEQLTTFVVLLFRGLTGS